jgi:uroporphyrinogen decarboxylase
MNRRSFLRSAAATTATLALSRPAFPNTAALTHKERVDRALGGQDVDRPPFTFYLHYKRPTAQLEAQDHLAFHRAYKTDIVKVMNDFDYPQSKTGKWYELKPLDSPYPQQLETLRIIRDNLNGDAYFIDTLYGPYMTAMILFQSQPEFANVGHSEADDRKLIDALHDFQLHHTEQWHTALEAITQSTIHHIRRSKEIGSSGALVSLFNTHSKYGPIADYDRFSRPYDKRVLDALADTRLTFLHLHNLDRTYLDQFRDFHAPVIQYSTRVSGIPIADARKVYSQTLAGGVDEIDFQKLTTAQMRTQWKSAKEQAGGKYIATPGCSVPNASTPAELSRLPQALGALT